MSFFLIKIYSGITQHNYKIGRMHRSTNIEVGIIMIKIQNNYKNPNYKYYGIVKARRLPLCPSFINLICMQ